MTNERLARLRGGFLSATLLSGLAAIAAPAQAQIEAAPSAGADLASDEAIVITGSRLQRDANLGSPSPIVTIEEEAFLGSSDATEVLRSVPALSASVSAASSLDPGENGAGGAAGQAFLNLRGLGPERTLTLVNGRRHVAGVAAQLDGVASCDHLSEAALGEPVLSFYEFGRLRAVARGLQRPRDCTRPRSGDTTKIVWTFKDQARSLMRPAPRADSSGSPKWHLLGWLSHGHAYNLFVFAWSLGNHWDKGVPALVGNAIYRWSDLSCGRSWLCYMPVVIPNRGPPFLGLDALLFTQPWPGLFIPA